MRMIEKSEDLQLQLVVTGSHLSSVHGNTLQEIYDDGFTVDKLIPILVEDDSGLAICRAAGLATIGIGEAFEALTPAIVVILGDRYEALSAGTAATLLRIPIAHIHGGELTEGLIDEACRHSLTKMASLHFCASAAYRQRILQLGEREDRVFMVGALAGDSLSELQLLSRSELCQDLKIQFNDVNFLVTFHPATLEVGRAQDQIEQVLAAIHSFGEANIFLTLPNAESESSQITQAIKQFAQSNPGRVFVFASLGQRRYFSLMKECDVVIGNSSSGLIEAPLLETVTVNIGNRQLGRLRGASVIDAMPTFESTKRSIMHALERRHNHETAIFDSPYGAGGAAQAIATVLAEYDLDNILIKRFIDRKMHCVSF